ncbi:MAG: hypothetical protein HFG26_10580 [Provencibacterium sp.]|nr:hypothetical protein [Provencibacterium sp.]
MFFAFNPFWELYGGILEGVVGFLEGLWGLLPLCGAALYVLRGIGLYRMAQNTGVSHPWFSWVPFLHEWQCARMGDRTRLSQKKSVFLEKGMLILAGGYLALTVLSPVFGRLFLLPLYRLTMLAVAVVLWVLRVLADYWLYADFEPSRAALYAVCSLFRLDGIPKFLLRDNIPVGVAGLHSPSQPKYSGQAGPEQTEKN